MLNNVELQGKNKDELIQFIHSDMQEKIESQQQTINYLHEQIRLLKHGKFASSSERHADNDPQGRLFDEAVAPENVGEIEEAELEITVPAHSRKKRGRKPLPKDLPRVEMIHDLADSEKTCPCGGELTLIGDERSEQLDIIPAKIQVIVHVHKKYACKPCGETIKTAKKPTQPIPNSIATPGSLAYVLTQKFQHHLPLYRQEKMLHCIGVDIPRATLSHWVIKSSELLQPLVNLLEDEVLDFDIAYADESTIQVLREPGKSAQSKSYMWCFGGGPPDRFSYVYHYHPSREHKKAIDFFEGFKGYLHCDGYQAYDNLCVKNKRVIQVGCWYHLRRKFFDATKVSKKSGLAQHFVEQIKKLSKIEKVIKLQKLDPEETKSYRQEHARIVIDKIKKTLDEHVDKVSSQGLLGKAIYYGLNQWPKLLTYLNDGRLDISNNRMERAIKPFATGRKNWMFANSVSGAKAAVIIYSLVETCKAHDVDPYTWLRHVLAKLPAAETVEQFEALLPFNFKNEIA